MSLSVQGYQDQMPGKGLSEKRDCNDLEKNKINADKMDICTTKGFSLQKTDLFKKKI